MSRRRRKRGRASKRGKSSAPVPVDPGEVTTPSPVISTNHPPATPATSIEGQVEIAHSVSVSGPLPPPEFFRAYEDTLPGAADRILAMAERQQEHRQSQESIRLNMNNALVRRGQWMAFLIVIAGVAAGAVLIMFDKPLAGFAALVGTIGTVAGAYIWSRRREANPSAPDSPQAASQQARPPTASG